MLLFVVALWYEGHANRDRQILQTFEPPKISADQKNRRWPRMIIIEADWKSQALAEVKSQGYRIVARTRANKLAIA